MFPAPTRAILCTVMCLPVQSAEVWSALDPGQRDALDEVALGEEEQDDDRQDGRGGGRHEVAPLGVVDALERGEAKGKGELAAVVEVDQRIEELVPGPDEGEDPDDHQRRLR